MSVSATSGIGFNASASKGSGQGSGQDTTYTNSQINAGNSVTLQSGGDTTLKGAFIAANQVKASAGGNLTIQSLQDASSYQSWQTSSGGSLSVSVTGVPTGGGILNHYGLALSRLRFRQNQTPSHSLCLGFFLA